MMELNCIPRLEKCCCCLSLRAGCLVIGYVSLVFSLITMGLVSLSVVNIVHFLSTHKHEPNDPITPEEMSKVAIALYVLHGYCLVMMLLYFGINLILVVSVHRNNLRSLRWFVNGALLVLVLALAQIVVSSVFQGAFVAMAFLAWCLWVFYSICIVRSMSLAELDEPEQKVQEGYPLRSLNDPNDPAPAGATSYQELLREA